ncbi:cardiolipin synthase [Komagataeibacter rhaeticus]|uniref:phospholipase D-like domain-containing protein n=1 Tax=Komagataeibacter rhaeticus TaxID=215221 RepID=UPI0004D526C3|nr:phospholipase D-like domain-containing protein [Komagataeibacter rhaeticus]KDU97007.1 phospholipase D [Komagataeibacter rhaeticus AF1]MBL7238783.1 PLDc N-terminal domain-containing protein [Komagataeibacter rhaeticus]PYD52564.1 cardiolipin synthase [Komagataeibacter rhaeticus]
MIFHALTIWDFFVLMVRIAIIVVVVVHVLLTKRDVGASIGWIGVTVLMPLTGGMLYAMFGINRVHRRARRMAGRHPWRSRTMSSQWRREAAGAFAPLASMVGKLTGRPLLGGNAITMLHDGDGAYPRMIAAIEGARHSVLLCSYIFRPDQAGQRFCTALIAAHRRGVQVRVLVDGVGSGYFDCGVGRILHRAGVPVGRFMHSMLPWRMPFINMRDHKKILVVDGLAGFMGGLNIGDENIVASAPAHPVSDTHFELAGPVVHQLSEAFARDWAFTTGEELTADIFFPPQASHGPGLCRIVTAGPDMDLEKIEYTMLQAFTLARHSIRVMTPYFLPDDRFLTELALAALRGIEVDVVVPWHSNHTVLDWARAANLPRFLDSGCRIWLARPPFNHSKLMVVDGQWSFVGSSNLDVRSLRLNFEINLETYDPALAGRLDAFIASHRHVRLTHHDLDRRKPWRKLRDAGARLLLPYL